MIYRYIYVYVHVYVHMYTPTPVVKFRKGFNLKTCLSKAQKSPQKKNSSKSPGLLGDYLQEV